MADSSNKYLGIRVTPELFRKMQRILVIEGMQITEYVKGLIREDLRKRGMLDDDTEQPEPATAGA